MVITGKGIQAEMRNESPNEYASRIRYESDGGRLVVVDEAGKELARSGVLHWLLQTPGIGDPWVLELGEPTRVTVIESGIPRWLRLLKPNGDDTGWRGVRGAEGSGMSIEVADWHVGLSVGQYFDLKWVRIYPPR